MHFQISITFIVSLLCSLITSEQFLNSTAPNPALDRSTVNVTASGNLTSARGVVRNFKYDYEFHVFEINTPTFACELTLAVIWSARGSIIHQVSPTSMQP